MLHTYIYHLMTLHITYLLPDIRTYRDVNRLQYSYIICYISSENASHGPAPEQKMFRDQTEATMFWPGTVTVLVPVLSLVRTANLCVLMTVHNFNTQYNTE